MSPYITRLRRTVLLLVAASLLLPRVVPAQGLTGTLIGTVRDSEGGVLPGARVRVSSPALIGGPETVTTDENGQLRFPALPPGPYVLDITLSGFASYHEEDIRVGAGATIERTAELKVGLAESIVVEGAGSRIEARGSGFETRFAPEYLRTIPTRRSSMFDLLRAAPGISPTSPGSGSITTVSAFGSGTNENQYLIDGTNLTSPSNGVARSEPGIDFIQEVQIQSAGASAEYGNLQGAVINVITRQGSERFLYDAAYYGQASALTSQPVRLPCPGCSQPESGYERARYRDFATNLGGPVARDRLWFFAGYHHLRDYDSQPGTDPNFPREYEQDKILAKLTWQLAPGWRLVQSVHHEVSVNPEQPTRDRPFDATLRMNYSVPAITFGHLTHASSGRTVWDVRVGRGVHHQDNQPSTGDRTIVSRFDRVTRLLSFAPVELMNVRGTRTNAKGTITHYQPGLLGADHEWKTGGQFERGDHHALRVIPAGARYVDDRGQPFQRISSDPSNSGGRFTTAAVFVSDALTLRDRFTINAGLRFDHTRANSHDLRALDAEARDTSEIVRGLGTMYTWNLFSPRLGVTAKLSADGRTLLRASYGRFNQGVLTGEIGPFHPGSSPLTTAALAPGAPSSVIDTRTNLLDPEMRTPRSDEYSVGVDREIGRRLAVSIVLVHKDGDQFIGWTDVRGQYSEGTRTLADGRSVPVFVLTNLPSDRRFQLTNPEGYALTYNGLVMVVEKRRSQGWQAFGSYTLSKAYGLQASSGTTAAGAQNSTVGAPANPFGRDPNDLTNARGRQPNDRPHMLRVMGSVDVPRTGVAIAANLQHVSGKPWAATGQISLRNGDQRILLEPRGTRRLSSQTLLDVRVTKSIRVGGVGRVELLLDVLNLLNDTAEESLASDTLATETLFTPNFGQPSAFMDPRRAMLSVRLNLGR